jgi:ABC-2 type transport system permease protein
LGFVSGGVSRGMLVAVIVTIVASLFVELNIHSYAVVGRGGGADLDPLFSLWSD